MPEHNQYDPQKWNTPHKDVIEDNYRHITNKQVDYLEILRNDLGYSLQARNAHFTTILKKPFGGDVWLLSLDDAGRLISELKKRKEERKKNA